MTTIAEMLEQVEPGASKRGGFVSANALAAFYGISTRTIHRYAHAKRCNHVHIGKRIVRYRRDQLLRMMAEDYPEDPDN